MIGIAQGNHTEDQEVLVVRLAPLPLSGYRRRSRD